MSDYAPAWRKSVGPFSMHITANEDGTWEARAHYLGNQCLVKKTYRYGTLTDAAWTLITDLQLVIYQWGKSLEGLRP